MAKTTVLEPQAEEIALTPEQIETVQKEINSTLVKRNVTDSLIKKYRDEYMGLTINGIEDKEGFETVYTARQTAKNTRILVKNICTEGRATLQAKAKQWIAKQKELTAQIEEIEAHLQKQEDAYQAEKDRIKAERKADEAKRLIGRTTLLTQMGEVFNGAEYVLDEVAYDLDVIRESDDKDWENIILPKYTAIFNAKETIRIAKQKADEEAERLRQEQQKEFERKEKELKDRQDELKRQQDQIESEKKKALDQRTKKRVSELESIGMRYSFQGESLLLMDLEVAYDKVKNFSDEDWAIYLDDLRPRVEKANAEIRAAKDAEQDRLNQLAIEKAEIERKQQDELRRQKEREELEEGDDLNRWVYFLKALPKEFPIMQSRQYKVMIEDAKEKIEHIRNLKATRKTSKATV
jgi:hypothetical protein